MPIYDYVCRHCGHVVEVIHAVDAAGPSECPVCGGPMRRAMSAPAVHFKGSGWAKKERASSKAGAKSTEVGEAAKPAPDSSPTTPTETAKAPASTSEAT